MANICSNEFYCVSEDSKNLEYIVNFLNENFEADCEAWDNAVETYFDSRWVFPEELMDEMFNGLPNKEDFYARCLSIEYGCDYVAYHKCDENGWYSVV